MNGTIKKHSPLLDRDADYEKTVSSADTLRYLFTAVLIHCGCIKHLSNFVDVMVLHRYE